MPLKQFLHGLMHLFYPRLCEGCSQPLLQAEQVLCLGCSMHLSQTDYHHIPDNETALRFAGRVPFSHATSFAAFADDSLLQHLLHGLKYKGKKETSIYLGKEFAAALRYADWIKEIDLIIPVPLHSQKQAARGYNQCHLIAIGMSDILHVPVVTDALIRTRHTESQTHKTRVERVSNMQDAFEVKNTVSIANKHLLLIDDVLTTGATLEACAMPLLAIPGVKISMATVGIAV